MRNRNVGFLIMGISLFIFLIIWLFNQGLTDIVTATCSHGPDCSMYETISTQTWLSVAIALVILLIGLFFVIVKDHENTVIREIKVKVKEKKKKIDLKGLDKDETEIIKLLQNEGKAMFQSDLMEKMEIGKVKTTRLLDKLESKQLIERKRRGMNNIVVLKD